MSVDKVDTVDIMDLAAGPSTVSTESTKSTSRGKEWQSLMALDILPPFMKQRQDNKGLIPTHGGYRNLKSFQLSEVIYDVTVRFCRKFVNPRSRTYDQMEQAARSGRQNIAEGSMASATSKKTEIKLTNVAKPSQEELRLDFEDFLRQRNLPVWDRNDPRRVDLIARRPRTADDVAGGPWT